MMLNFVCYFLGYLTCYLEFTGKTWSGLAAAAGASALFFIRAASGEVTRPFVHETVEKLRKSDSRTGRLLSYFAHHLGNHPTITTQDCTACAIK